MTASGNDTVTEDDLHAFVDGVLSPDRLPAVEAWLAANPEAAGEVAAWKAQNEGIRALFAMPEAPPQDPAAQPGEAARRPRRTLRLSPAMAALAASVLLTIGGAAGAYLSGYRQAPAPQAGILGDLPHASRANYTVYASEVRHPVEVRAEEEDHLVTWLSRRLGSSIVAPDLGGLGFSLVGGRLVSFAGGPGALLMYEDAQGRRVTLLAGRNESNTQTGFLFDRAGDVSTFYWIDRSLGYAISGALEREVLEALALEIYRQL